MVMQFKNAEKGSLRESTAATELARTILHRRHLDDSVKLIGEILFAGENSVEKLTAVRPAGTVVVDDWACLKTMVRMTGGFYYQLCCLGCGVSIFKVSLRSDS
jgi:legumain